MQVGLCLGQQNKEKTGRHLFALKFRGVPMILEITIANNGYIVGINPRSNTCSEFFKKRRYAPPFNLSSSTKSMLSIWNILEDRDSR
jgi:hypothetical protein